MEILWLLHFFLMLCTLLALYCMKAPCNQLSHTSLTLFCCYCWSVTVYTVTRNVRRFYMRLKSIVMLFQKYHFTMRSPSACFATDSDSLAPRLCPGDTVWRLPVQQLNRFSAVSSSQFPLSDCRTERKWLRENVSKGMREFWRNG